MKKFALALSAALFCFPIVGLTGCGGGGSTEVIEAPAQTEEMSEADQAAMDAAMDAEMNDQE